MKRWIGLGVLLLAGYLCSGFYVVRGNEKASVRRFGKAQYTNVGTDAGVGTVSLRSSGLYFDLPWPFVEVDRVNVSEVRTLTIGSAEADDIEGSQFLQAVDAARQSQFLSGDKNILNLQIRVHYRISEEHVGDFLYGSLQPEQRLQLLAEAALADVVLRSGVDFVHTLGRSELRELMIRETRKLAETNRLGLEVDDVSIGSVYPPIRVKAQFLDVMNARADKQTYINQARAYAEQQQAAAFAMDQKIRNEAEIFKQQTVESARGKADSFTKIVDRFKVYEQQGIQSYAAARQMALKRRYIETMEEIFRKAAGKVLLDSGKSVDLTIFRDPKE